MRVRIIFKLKNRGASLPFHHQHLLAQFVKGALVKGNNQEFSNYTYYSFSGLKGQTKVGRDGLRYHSNFATLVFSSPNKDFIDYLLTQIFSFKDIVIGNLELGPLSVEKEKSPEFEDVMKFICISPVVLFRAQFNDETGKRFILPEADEFSDLLYESVMERMEASKAYSSKQIESFSKFQIIPDVAYLNKLRDLEKKFARIYSVFDSDVKYEVRGYTLPFQLYAAKEVQEFIFNCGLGHYAYKGFGMVDIANVNPIDRTETYNLDAIKA